MGVFECHLSGSVKADAAGSFACVTMWVPVGFHNSATLCLPFCGSCVGARILGVSLSLEVCVRDCLWCDLVTVYGVDLGSMVMCVWLWGYFCSCFSGSPPCLSASSWHGPKRGRVATPSEGGFLGWKPFSPEARMGVLPATLAHLSPAC